MPQAGVKSPTAPIAARATPPKKKRKEEEPVAPTPTTPDTSVKKHELAQKLTYAEAKTKSTLPSDFVYEVAAAATDSDEAAAAAAAVARDLSFPRIADSLRGTDPPFDPVTGGPLTTKTMRRLEIGVIAETVAKQFEALQNAGVKLPARGRPIRDPDIGVIQREVVHKLDPNTLQAYIEAMAPLPGELNATTAIGAAVTLATEKVDRDRFQSAIQAFSDWNGETGPLGEDEVIAYSHWWATSGRQEPPSREQIVDVVYPEVGAARRLQQVAVQTFGGPRFGGLARQPGNPAYDAEVRRLQVLKAGIEYQPNRYREQALQLAGSVLDSRRQAENSFTGKVFGGLFEGLDRAWHAVAAVAYTAVFVPGRVLVAGVTGEEPGTGQDVNAWQEFQLAMDDAWDILTYKERPGDQVATDIGLVPGSTAHTIASVLTEFAVGWELDPFVLVGRFRKALGLRRLVTDPAAGEGAMRLLSGTRQFRGLAVPKQAVTDRVAQLFSRKVPPAWRRFAESSKDISFNEWWVRQGILDPDLAAELPRGLYGRGEGLDRTTTGIMRRYMADTYDLTPATLRGGKEIPTEALDDAQDLFLVAIGDKSASVLGRQFDNFISDTLPQVARRYARQAEREAEQAVLEQGERVATAVREAGEEGAERLTVEAVGTAADPIRYRDEVAWQLEGRGLQRVIPTKGMGLHQSLRDTRIAIGRSDFWRSKAMSWLRPVTEMKANVATSLEDIQGPEMFGRWMQAFESRGKKVFSAERVAMGRDDYAAISRLATADREARWSEMIEATIREAYAGMDLPVQVVEGIIDKMMRGYSQAQAASQRSFGYRAAIRTGEGPTPLTEPVFETQLLNTLVLPDPDLIRHSIRDAVGSAPRMREASLKRFGREIESLSEPEWRQLLDSPGMDVVAKRFMREQSERAREAFLAAWKPAVLLRPAWTVRVVLIEENVRGFVALQNGIDRLLSLPFGARAAKRLGVQERFVSLPAKGGDIELPIHRLSGLLPPEGAASSIARTEVYTSAAAREANLAKTLGELGRPMVYTDTGYFTEFARILNHQVGQSPLGRRVVQTMLQKTDESGLWTRDRIVKWLTTDRRAGNLLGRTGRTPEEAVDRAWAFMDYYTGGDPHILGAILNETQGVTAPAVSEELLARVFRKRADGRWFRKPPQLHSLTVDEAMLRRGTNAFRRRLDNLFNVFSRRPTDYLSRQPMFKATFARERERLLRLSAERLRREGQELGPDALARLEQRVDGAARDFALGQVRKVMYSLTERTRFAEAHQFLLPFFAPFQEQITVWSALLWENPAAMGHARLLFKSAAETGIIKKDEETGEWMIPIPGFSGITTLLSAMVGMGGKPVPGEWGISMRLESLNLFVSSAIKLPTGAIAGDVSVPMPGFSWPAMELIQEFVKHGPLPEGLRGVLADWAFQYGPDTSLLPKPWERMMAAAFPDLFKGTVDQTANHMLDYAAAAGLRIGTQKEMADGNADYSPKQARLDARKFLAMRALMGWTLPAAPEINFPQAEIREELFSKMQTDGYDEALDWLKETYPDRPDILMLAISHTMWNRDSPSIPATEAATRIMSNPEFEKAAKDFPEFAYALIPREAREGGFDYNAYLLQLAEGVRKSRLPEERIKDLNQRQGWSAYFALQDHFTAAVDRLGAEEGDPTWNILDGERDTAVSELAESNPAWASDYAEVEIFDHKLHEHLRLARSMLDSSPILASTDTGRGLREYLDGRDEIAATMKRYDITGLDTSGAKGLGLDKDYEALVEETKARHPDFAQVYDLWFTSDLRRIERTARDEFLDTLPPKAVERVAAWQAEWTDRRQALFNAANDVDQARAGASVRAWSLQAEKLGEKYGVNPQEVWWRTMTEAERVRERLQTATVPYLFLSQFERRTVLGLETSDAAEQDWLKAARRRIQLEADVREAQFQGKPTGVHYEAYDAYLKSLAAKNPDFAKELQRSQGFGYALFEVLPSTWTKGDTAAAEAWRQIRDLTTALGTAFQEKGITSFEDTYTRAKLVFEDYVAEWKDYSHLFKNQWEYLDSLSQGSVIDTMIPSVFFPLQIGGKKAA